MPCYLTLNIRTFIRHFSQVLLSHTQQQSLRGSPLNWFEKWKDSFLSPPTSSLFKRKSLYIQKQAKHGKCKKITYFDWSEFKQKAVAHREKPIRIFGLFCCLCAVLCHFSVTYLWFREPATAHRRGNMRKKDNKREGLTLRIKQEDVLEQNRRREEEKE